MEAVGFLQEVGQRVAVLVRLCGIGGDPGAERRAVVGKAVDVFPAIQLLTVEQPIAVGVEAIGIGVQHCFVVVAQAVAVIAVEIAVSVQGVGAVLELVQVRQAIVVAVPEAVVGIGTASGLVEQPVAVGVLQRREDHIAVLTPGQSQAALLECQLVEPVQRLWEDVEPEVLAHLDVVGGLFGAYVADRDKTDVWDPRKKRAGKGIGDHPALLDRDGISL